MSQDNFKSYTDEEIFALISEDNATAFEIIYDRYWKRLFVVATNKLGDVYEAEDVVQELFIELWRNRKNTQIIHTVNTYLASALKYKILRSRIKRDKKEIELNNYASTKKEQDNEPEEYLTFEELQTKLDTLVNTLPEKCRLVYKMNKEDGMSSEEISEELNLSKRTVESHLYRAMKTLKNGLHNCVTNILQKNNLKKLQYIIRSMTL